METTEKGLSILIPVFNVDIRVLVKDLSNQLAKQSYSYEIRLYDDGSLPEFKELNKEVSSINHCFYKELSENIGRSSIRNLLAKESTYQKLLFIDCDMQIYKEDYIKSYFLNNSQVLLGGISYQSNRPVDSSLYLHWFVGKNKEEKSAFHRNKDAYASFLISNAFISKDLFLAIRLNENIKSYGHEDTLFGEELQKRNIKVIHIDNPICHMGLNEAEVFLSKTRIGVETLAKIVLRKEGGQSTKIVRTYNFLRKWKLANLFIKLYSLIHNKVYKNLVSKRPILMLYDLYKLNYFIKGMKNPSF